EPVVAPVAAAPVAAPVAAPAPVAPQAAPAAASQPIVVPAAAPSAKAQALHDVVNAAGLQWVETDPDRHAQTQLRIAAAHTPVRLGRERKPVAPVSNEPLVQVETRH
ncbi:ribonuclease E/G, partial [Achromobacter anxifer]|nr:ribonuclease E/G [Achromobacter anxifer]